MTFRTLAAAVGTAPQCYSYTTWATKHYHGSDHPVTASFEPGENWRWCYAEEVLV